MTDKAKSNPLSGKIMQLKFMQRAQEKRQLQQAEEKLQQVEAAKQEVGFPSCITCCRRMTQFTALEALLCVVGCRVERNLLVICTFNVYLACPKHTACMLCTQGEENMQDEILSTEQPALAGAVGGQKKCVIIYDRDPLPAAATVGRLSFGGQNPTIERLQEERIAKSGGAPKGSSGSQACGTAAAGASSSKAGGKASKKEEGAEISEADMAKAFMRAPQPGANDFQTLGYKPLREAKKRKTG